MSAKDFRLGSDALQSLLGGVTTLAGAVKVTLRAKRSQCDFR